MFRQAEKVGMLGASVYVCECVMERVIENDGKESGKTVQEGSWKRLIGFSVRVTGFGRGD